MCGKHGSNYIRGEQEPQDQKFLGMMLVEARMISQPNCSTLHGIQLKIQLAPELLLGAEQYSTTIDMWSMGCIMVEKLSKEPLFNGKIEVNQIDKIFRILGTPNEMIWEGFSKLPGVKLPSLGDSGLAWLSGFLYDSLWRVRREMESPDPHKEQRRKKL
ncbi:hypothetical protein FXO38_16650, partial [Capsicum annuum]